MTRRHLLIGAAAVSASGASAAGASNDAPSSPFGVCIYSYNASRKFTDTLEFLDHCHALGAAGIQMSLPALGDAALQDYAKRVRARAESYGMYYEGIVVMPKTDTVEFERQLLAAKAAGAALVRSASLGSRRYETFSDLAAWRQFEKDRGRSIELALPVLEKHRIALALENHKDWTVGEMAAAFSKLSSEYFGVCLDFGNNISLLDAPNAVAELAPYAISTHVKDIAVARDPVGFRMTEVPLTEGVVDVKGLIDAIRSHRPRTRFTLEMITREPLLIPCLADNYWATFPDRSGLFLARALRLVGEHARELPHDTSAAAADANVAQCLAWGREHLA